MKIVINRSVRRPGLIDGARTFYLEYNPKGLYIISLGKATQAIPQTADIISTAIANKALGIIQNKYEKKIVETETRLQSVGVEEMLKEKHAQFIPAGGINEFKSTPLSDGSIQLKIKGGKTKITLYVHGYYGRTIQDMQLAINLS